MDYWTRGRTIGHGSSAAVSIATLRLTGEISALKSAELSRSEPLQRENKILSTLNHPNIIGYKGCDISLENGTTLFNLVIEYARGGTLTDAIRRRGARLNVSTIAHYTRGILNGLDYLHSRGIVHCDIKGSNILLTDGAAKIADFGCAKTVNEATIGGTPMYMSPEATRGDEQFFPADIWALGCTVIEMATGNPPWPNSTTTLRRVAFSGETPEIPAFLSESARDFLSKCLSVDPNERWMARELLKHRFLDEFRLGQAKQGTGKTCSPTSILDQGIWSSVEEEFPEASSSDQMIDDDLMDGHMHRIKELFVFSEKENWDWEGSWITVRDGKNVNKLGLTERLDLEKQRSWC